MKLVPLRDLLVAVATFLVVAAFMVHVLAAQRFAASWPPASATTTSTDSSATFLDPLTLETREATLTRRRSVVGVDSLVRGADAVLVSTTIVDPAGSVVIRQRWSAVQDRFTGTAIDSPANIEKVTSFNGSGDAVEGERRLVDVQGVVVRFPRNTQPVTYRRWDPETSRTGMARFVRRDRLAGKDVLVFQQAESAPAAGSEAGTYSETTMWVRPEVGGVVKTDTHLTVRTSGGVTILDANFVDSANSVMHASTDVDRVVARARLTGDVIPILVLVLGVVTGIAAALEGGAGWFTRRLCRGRDRSQANN